MISLDEAQARLWAAVVQRPLQRVSLDDAVGRVLREDLLAVQDRPSQARAAMDGYALRIADLGDALTLRLGEPIYAGHSTGSGSGPALQKGEAVYVATGAALPAGANTVVRVERVQVERQRVQLESRPEIGQDIRPQAEEWRHGELLVEAGQTVTPQVVAVAAANGLEELAVSALPRVGVRSSGDEILGRGQDKVADSNGPFLRAFCRARGIEAVRGPVLPDDADTLAPAVKAALADVDLLITTGGMSVGERDHMVEIAQKLGAQILFHRVALRPGRPVGAARIGDTLWLMVPGSPGAVWAASELLLAPLLAKLGAPTLPSRIDAPVFVFDAPPKTTGSDVRMTPGSVSGYPDRWELQRAPFRSRHHLLTPLRTDGYALIGPSPDGEPAPWVQYRGTPPKAAPRWPACLAVTGASGSGKTTLIRKLLDHLSPDKRVVVIKHSHHPVPPEPPHKDTARFLQAGAHSVLFVSERDFVLRSSGEPWDRPRLQRWAAMMDPRPDLVIIEGFSKFPGPKMEVLGPQDERQAADLAAPELLACVIRGRQAPKLDIPVFDSEDIAAIASWLLSVPADAR